MRKFFIILFLAIISNFALAQNLTNIGYSAFNITARRFNCNAFLASLNKVDELHISFLYHTFGKKYSCLTRVIQDERLKTLEIHLINEAGHRNSRLGKYEFLYDIENPEEYNDLLINEDQNLKTKFVNYVQPLKEYLEFNLRSDIEVLISPGLESNVTDTAAKVLIAWTREIFPDFRIVWTPYPFAQRRLGNSTADLIEAHGLFNTNSKLSKLKAPCIYNIDGADISYVSRSALGEDHYTESTIKNWVQSGSPLFQLYEDMANRCEYAFIWTAESNGLTDGQFVDPRKRNHRISRSMYKVIMRDLKLLHRRGIIYSENDEYTSDDMQIADSCSSIRDDFEDGIGSGRLLKQSESRYGGAVLLIPKPKKSIESIALYKGSDIIDTFVKTGEYHDGRIVYRSSLSPTRYPLKTFLVFQKKRRKICYKLHNPRVRLD